MRINISLAIVFFLVLVLSYSNTIVNTSAIQTNPPEGYGGTLIDSSTADAQIFNPVISSDSASSNIENFIFEGMLTYDEDMDIIPQLAHSWDISENKLDYTFYLRKDVYWHDGEKFTADDVIFTWDRILDPETDTTRASMFDLLDLENVPYEMIDDYTIVFHLKTTFSPMLNNMMFSIIPEHIYENHAGADRIKSTDDDCREGTVYTFNDDQANKEPIGTGCMMFFEWEIDNHITLIRNSIDNGGPGYWHEHDAYLDRYIIRVISNVNVQLLSLKNGDIDMMDLSSTLQEDIEDLRTDLNINVYSSPTFTSDHIAFQCDPSKGSLHGQESRDFESDPNYFAGFEWQTVERPEITGHLVRQALNYAIDKQGLIDHTYPQGSRNLGPMYLAQYEWYNEDVNPYNYNLTKANELLDQAGFGASANDPLRKELNFSLTYYQGNLRREKTCEFASAQWAELGITVEIENLEWYHHPYLWDDRYFDAMAAGWTGGGGDPDLTGVWSSRNIMPGGQLIGLNPDGTWIWSGTPRMGGLNYMSYWNPTADLLMDEARIEESYNIRKNYYDQIQEIIVDDSPYIWLLAHVNMIAVSSDFYGFTTGSTAGFWSEPQGFKNIHYIYAGMPPYTTNEDNTEIFDLFFNLEIESIPIINKLKFVDIVLLMFVAYELILLIKVVQKTILKK